MQRDSPESSGHGVECASCSGSENHFLGAASDEARDFLSDLLKLAPPSTRQEFSDQEDLQPTAPERCERSTHLHFVRRSRRQGVRASVYIRVELSVHPGFCLKAPYCRLREWLQERQSVSGLGGRASDTHVNDALRLVRGGCVVEGNCFWHLLKKRKFHADFIAKLRRCRGLHWLRALCVTSHW